MSERMRNIHTTFIAIICLALTQVVSSRELSPYTVQPDTVVFDLPDVKGNNTP